MSEGWSHRRACGQLGVKETRVWRWRTRRGEGRLGDQAAGGHPVHALLAEEVDEILALFEAWGEVDRSHRKLAHRGSYLQTVWVSPSTVKRVLAAQGLHLKRARRAGSSTRRPFPDWATYTKGTLWIYDATHFTGCPGISVLAILDLVTRKWLCTNVSAEETSTQVQVIFTRALEAEGLWSRVEASSDGLVDLSVEQPALPVLLAISDNGPQMTSGSTREFMAMCAIAQHFGRPGTPKDQAWIESFFGHLKFDFPHLSRIEDAAVLAAELEHARYEYNGVRLHAGIGYVTPDDEHEGRGPAIRKARRDGLAAARARRIAFRRTQRDQNHQPPP
jgi:putative transposase